MLLLQLGITPLMYAAKGGHLEIVQYLVSQGSNLEIKSEVVIDSLLILIIILKKNKSLSLTRQV